MITPSDNLNSTDRLNIDVHLKPVDLAQSLRDDVRRGLAERPFQLPPKWFYDATGSEIFEQITTLTEYYPTEAERVALTNAAASIVQRTAADTVVELGSGSSDKTRVLLDAFAATGQLVRYVPFDVSESALRAAAGQLADRYQELSIHGVVGDFDQHLAALPADGHRLLIFLGGTIGNYAPGPRAALLSDLAATLKSGEWLLLGTDLVKNSERLVAAYDDAEGVTAKFNLNVLSVVNRELGANFDPSKFDHVAVWNAEDEWIEMRLRAAEACQVKIPELSLTIDFAEGEEVLTEISAKFKKDGITNELADAGFELVEWWTDPAGDFALSLSRRI